jgi:hypothetical protein
VNASPQNPPPRARPLFWALAGAAAAALAASLAFFSRPPPPREAPAAPPPAQTAPPSGGAEGLRVNLEREAAIRQEMQAEKAKRAQDNAKMAP